MEQGKILVIDDHEMIRSMLMSILCDEGHDCWEAQNAEEAMSVIEVEDIDLALIDIMMPGISGVQTLLALKNARHETRAIMATATDDIDTAMFCIHAGADDYIVKPFQPREIITRVDAVLRKKRAEEDHCRYLTRLEKDLRMMSAKVEGMAKSDAHNVLSLLIKALDAREKETGSHSGRVRAYTQELASAMGVKGDELENMTLGAMLHDIGKIGIPDSILLKAGHLDQDEWQIIQKHPQIGYDIISEINFLKDCAEIVIAHHERYDGFGYPKGLKGEEIPLGARIFSVVDTLDAMTSDRPYRKALSFKNASEEIKRCRGTQFDPEVVDVFLSISQSTWQKIAADFPSQEGPPVRPESEDMGRGRNFLSAYQRDAAIS